MSKAQGKLMGKGVAGGGQPATPMPSSCWPKLAMAHGCWLQPKLQAAYGP
jgi:hypothetical protein